MDESTAKTVIIKLVSICDELETILILIKANVTKEEYAGYRKAIPQLIASLDLEVLDIIFREHPELQDLDPSRAGYPKSRDDEA